MPNRTFSNTLGLLAVGLVALTACSPSGYGVSQQMPVTATTARITPTPTPTPRYTPPPADTGVLDDLFRTVKINGNKFDCMQVGRTWECSHPYRLEASWVCNRALTTCERPDVYIPPPASQPRPTAPRATYNYDPDVENEDSDLGFGASPTPNRFDVDGDGMRNDLDQDIDGDGQGNLGDTDMDGDLMGDRRDSDIDGEGTNMSCAYKYDYNC